MNKTINSIIIGILMSLSCLLLPFQGRTQIIHHCDHHSHCSVSPEVVLNSLGSNSFEMFNYNSPSGDDDGQYYEAILYYPGALEDSNMSQEAFEQFIKSYYINAIYEYDSLGSIERNTALRYVGPLNGFDINDSANKVMGQTALGDGNYVWVKELENTYDIVKFTFILPNNHPIGNGDNLSLGYAVQTNNSNRRIEFYKSCLALRTVLEDKRATFNHESGHNFGLMHQKIDSYNGGDINGYAAFISGKYGTANMASFNGGAQTVNAPSYPGFVYEGTALGSTNENARAVVIDEIPFLNGLKHETTIIAADSSYCIDTEIDLFSLVESNGNLSFTILNGSSLLEDNILTLKDDTQLLATAQQSGKLYAVSDTLTILAASCSSAPTASCRSGLTIKLDADGNATLTADEVDGGSSDSDGNIVSRTINGQSSITWTCAEIGTKSITLKVTDNDNLSGSCTTTIEVVDETAPAISCTPIEIELESGQMWTVPLSDLATATDNCSAELSTSDELTFSGSNPDTYTIEVMATDPSDNSTSCTTDVVVKMPSATKDLERLGITLYPNPVKDVLYLKGDLESIAHIEVYDLTGRRMASSISTGRIDLSTLPSGTYMIKIIMKDGDIGIAPCIVE